MSITPPDTPISRANPFSSYVAHMTAYLKKQYPNCSEKRINEFVTEIVQTRCKQLWDNYKQAKSTGEEIDFYRTGEKQLWPTLQVLHYSRQDDPSKKHAYGNQTFYEDMSALEIIQSSNSKIITPFGTVYETVDKCSSFVKGMITKKTKDRKKEKKLMLEAKKAGDKTAATFHNNQQATIKINMNSLIGGMGAQHCFLSNKANFNSVTSASRYFVMNSYAHVERFLCANFYFQNEDDLINHVINCNEHGPDPKIVRDVVERYHWHVPTSEEVYEFLTGCLHRNMVATEHPRVASLLESLEVGTLCFIFYMSNFKHMVFKNESFWRAWIEDFFSTDNVRYETDVAPDKVASLDSDLLVVLSTVYHDHIPTNAAGNSISAYDCIAKAPEIAKKLYCIGVHMQKKIDEIMEIFDVFTNHKIGIPRVADHKFMFRDAVLLSDTDSSIFVTKDWVKWYTGSYSFSPQAFNINALVVYFLCKANASVLANLSIAFGALGQDIFGMNMKNEFMMPILILTSAKKCYMSMLKIQEGVFYSEQKLDIKGVALRGSNFGKLTLNYVQWFIQSILTEIYTRGTISVKKYIVAILQFERTVYDSLYNGETKFLTVTPVKNEDEYENGESSIFFNYLAWEHIFGEKYGNIVIPTKCYILPLKNIKNFQYQDFLTQNFPDIAEKLKKFTTAHPKPLTRIPINPVTNKIPEELRTVADYRSVIYTNSRPLYFILTSFGIVDGSLKKQNRLYSDTYGWIELSKEDRDRITEITKENELE